MATKEHLLAILEEIEEPALAADLVAAGMVRDLRLEGGRVRLTLARPYPDLGAGDPLVAEVEEALGEAPGVTEVAVTPALEVPAYQGSPGKRPGVETWSEQHRLPGVRNVVAVASGKGGVGKSTVTANLAVTLARAGARVGLMDADIYGPSGPLMMGIAGKPKVVDDKMLPLDAHGVKLMSLGLLTGAEDAQIWRGPMVQSAIRQLLKDVDWGELDYLLVDMPPGTGDVQLSLVQQVPLTGAVVVSTPQAAALLDVRKGVTMFRKAEVEILGVVENMSFFRCGDCGARHEIFAHQGAAAEAERQGAVFLGELPLDARVRAGGDSGVPVAAGEPESDLAAAFRAVAAGMTREVARVASRSLPQVFAV